MCDWPLRANTKTGKDRVKEQYFLSVLKGTSDELVSEQKHDITNARKGRNRMNQ
jgi:hypothetical protein